MKSNRMWLASIDANKSIEVSEYSDPYGTNTIKKHNSIYGPYLAKDKEEAHMRAMLFFYKQ